MTKEYNHIKYMTIMAKNHRAIAHSEQTPRFFVASGLFSIDGLLNSLTNAQYPCIVAEVGPDIRVDDNTSDNTMFRPFYTVNVLFQAEAGNSLSVLKARDRAKRVAQQIAVNMILDAHNRMNGLDLLNAESIRISGIGPLADSAHGVSLTFTLREHIGEYESEEWFEPRDI